MLLIAKVITISRVKFHCNRLTTVQDIQDYVTLIFDTQLGTNLIHGKKARFHGRVFKMCQISQKIHGRSLRNSRAPQPLFRGAMLMQTKRSVE